MIGLAAGCHPARPHEAAAAAARPFVRVYRAGWNPTYASILASPAQGDPDVDDYMASIRRTLGGRVNRDEFFHLADAITRHGPRIDSLLLAEHVFPHSGGYWWGLVVEAEGRVWCYASGPHAKSSSDRGYGTERAAAAAVAAEATAASREGVLQGFEMLKRAGAWSPSRTAFPYPRIHPNAWLIHLYRRYDGAASYLLDYAPDEYDDAVIAGRQALATVPRTGRRDWSGLAAAIERVDPATQPAERVTAEALYEDSYPARLALIVLLRAVRPHVP